MPNNGVKDSSGKAGSIEVTVRHATNGTEMKVVLPANAKFKHVKAAMARRLESDEVLVRGQLMNNNAGIYSAYKDHHRIGDVRFILALCVDMEVPDDGPMQAVFDDADMSDQEETKAQTTTAAASSSKPSVFNRTSALGLQKELLEGFQAKAFQNKLRDLESRLANGLPQAQFTKDRQELFLTVQSVVLPKYNFEGTQSGVYKMMGSMGPFINDPEFVKLASEINRTIGVESPQDSWAALSKSCRNVEEEPYKPGKPKPKLPPRARGFPGMLGAGLGGLGGLGSSFSSLAPPAPMAQKVLAKSGGPAGPPEPRSKGPQGGPAGPPEPRGPTRAQGQSAPAPAAQAQETSADADDAPLFDPWPAQKTPPFRLFVAGSWNNYEPTQMQWQEGIFASPITLGPQGLENFQILLNGDWGKTYYPSLSDASALDDHTVRGPDNKGHGLNWQIGKYAEEDARPKARFVIIAGIDSNGTLRLVSWQPVG